MRDERKFIPFFVVGTRSPTHAYRHHNEVFDLVMESDTVASDIGPNGPGNADVLQRVHRSSGPILTKSTVADSIICPIGHVLVSVGAGVGGYGFQRTELLHFFC